VLDREAVQLKNENQQLLVYCLYQYYQLTGENKIACPLDKVVSLPIHTNVSIWRHPLRSPNTPIVQYTYGTLAITSNTQFELPSDVKLIAPNIDRRLNVELQNIRSNITQALTRSEQHRKNLKWKFIEYVRTNGTSMIRKIFIGLGITFTFLVLLGIVIFVLRKVAPLRPVPKPTSSFRVKIEPPAYSSDEEDNTREPKVRFYDERRERYV